MKSSFKRAKPEPQPEPPVIEVTLVMNEVEARMVATALSMWLGGDGSDYSTSSRNLVTEAKERIRNATNGRNTL